MTTNAPKWRRAVGIITAALAGYALALITAPPLLREIAAMVNPPPPPVEVKSELLGIPLFTITATNDPSGYISATPPPQRPLWLNDDGTIDRSKLSNPPNLSPREHTEFQRWLSQR